MQSVQIARAIEAADDALLIDVLDNLQALYPNTYNTLLRLVLDNADWHLDDDEKAETIKVLQGGDV
jgi:hypothetical protein